MLSVPYNKPAMERPLPTECVRFALAPGFRRTWTTRSRPLGQQADGLLVEGQACHQGASRRDGEVALRVLRVAIAAGTWTRGTRLEISHSAAVTPLALLVRADETERTMPRRRLRTLSRRRRYLSLIASTRSSSYRPPGVRVEACLLPRVLTTDRNGNSSPGETDGS